MGDDRAFDILKGQTLTAVVVDRERDEIKFSTTDKVYLMFHHQSCCENVYIKDIVGDIEDLIGTPILAAEERGDTGYFNGRDRKRRGEYSWTHTFYTLRTIKGSVDISWSGSSNGYYSESVDFEERRS
jgi:hypothetical protein